LNADLQKKREKVARLEQELLAAKEDYVKAEKAEQEFLLSVGLSSTQSKPQDESTTDQINVIIDNKATCIPRNDIIYLSDIEASVCSRRESFADNYRRSNYGVRECLHPPGLTCVPTKDWGRYKLSHEYIERLFKLLKGEKCTFSKTAQYLFGCGYHCNSGGSDEAAINIQAATLRGLFHDIGIPQTKITNLMIAKSLPSRTQIRNIELELGAGCFLAICWEIDQDGTLYISWQFDHGHRKGQEHFIKLISWGGYDDEGNAVIKCFCVDASRCGHSAEEAARSIKEIDDLIKLLLEEVVGNSAMSDSGGGSAIQNVMPKLIELGVLIKEALKNHCACHGANKPIEVGLKTSLGDAGMGHDSPFQCVYVGDILMDQAIIELGKEEVDRIWREINELIMNDPRFQNECLKHGGLTFDEYYESVQRLSNEDPALLFDLLNHCPTDRKDPVFSRWMTVLLAIDAFLYHYFTLYLFAIQIKGVLTAKTSLCQNYACSLLALMRIKPDASNDDDTETPPVFYVVLLFVQAFGRAFFLDVFGWIMRNNPDFGTMGTYGHLSPYCVECLHRP
jgi:hypothetical protein